ncbi:MAG: nicotinate-nucleotide adenylyltransferase, partial [Pseudomonadota bacterium]
QLDAVWWIVAKGNPLKSDHGDFAKRLASAAEVAAHPRMRVTALEADLGLTYTVDTLAWLQLRYRQHKFVWLMGSDNLSGFHNWKNWETIAKRVPIAVVARPGARPGHSPFERRFASARLPEHAAGRLALYDPPAWTFLKAPFNAQSSTNLRSEP